MDILLVDGGYDGLDRHGFNDHLKMVFRPAEFLVLFQLDKVPAFGVVCNVWVGEGWFFEPDAV